MKKCKFVYLMIFAITSMLIVGCEEEDDSNTGNGGDFTTGVTFQYEGETHTVKETSDLLIITEISGIISISANVEQGFSVSLTIPESVGEGEHDLATTSSYNLGASMDVDDARYDAEEGTIHVTMLDAENKQIEGKFNFTATKGGESKEITEGQFSVSY